MTSFRRYLIHRIAFAAGMAGVASSSCSSDTIGEDDDSTAGTAGPSSGSGSEITTECFPWPMEMGAGGAGAGAGAGGGGGAGGTSQGGSETRASGGATMGAGGDALQCPTQEEAMTYIGQQGCSSSIISDGTFQTESCCYSVEVVHCLGRPFLIDGEPLQGQPRWGVVSDWCPGLEGGSATSSSSLEVLTAAQRQLLAEQWCADAIAEHASVASFARCALELMAFGAPAELVEQAHQAALDEIRHARACFSLAARYRGESVSPSSLPLPRELAVASNLAELAAHAALEGCIGETLAALQACAQLEAASDPSVRRVLSAIAEEETRHAELAWRIVRWAIRQGGEEVASVVQQTFEKGMEAIVEANTGAHLRPDAVLAAHGRLDANTMSHIRRHTAESLVRPCADALRGVAPTVGLGELDLFEVAEARSG